MLIAFPSMHPELSDCELPGLRFLDSGMGDEGAENLYRPDGLPMDRKTANALINDCISFGEQFKDPAEMAYFGARTAEEFYEGSSMSIQAQLAQRFDDGQGTKQERERREAAARAQFVLILAWFFEERMIELQSIEQGVKNSWKSMDETLGVEDGDRVDGRVLDLSYASSHTGGASDGQTVRFPWQRVVEALPAFVPHDAVLVCSDPAVIEFWEELEIPFDPADDSLELPSGARVAVLPAWRFAGRRKVPAEFPMAANEITMAVIPSRAE